MAENVTLVTFSGGTVVPKTDGIIYDSAIGQCGVFYGCHVTASDNTVYVSSGYGMIRGRFYEMADSSVAVTLAPSGTLSGRIYLRLDLSNTTDPLQLLVATGSTLPDLTQEEDANFTNGVWEMELGTFDVSVSAVENVVETFEVIEDNNSRLNVLEDLTKQDYTRLTGSYGINVFYKKVGPIRILHFGGDAVGNITTHTFTIVEDIDPPPFYMSRLGAIGSNYLYYITVASNKTVTIQSVSGQSLTKPYINMTFIY